jgi:hypothetical protein
MRRKDEKSVHHAKTQRREDATLAAKPLSNPCSRQPERLVKETLPAAQSYIFAPLRLRVMKKSPRFRASA